MFFLVTIFMVRLSTSFIFLAEIFRAILQSNSGSSSPISRKPGTPGKSGMENIDIPTLAIYVLQMAPTCPPTQSIPLVKQICI